MVRNLAPYYGPRRRDVRHPRVPTGPAENAYTTLRSPEDGDVGEHLTVMNSDGWLLVTAQVTSTDPSVPVHHFWWRRPTGFPIVRPRHH